ncbi:unnamed protein product [Pelagomonas calceolata]|uniref:MYND-type domain-containing protein n=1 Tax=Pelagomonas calceolata TaxID=35677 RepID=A0A8J2S747_9STRA|nr:unnamed protein product [Pelagomonas calceolata]
MILTQCAVCATDLGLTLGKKCGRCNTRYCGPECQVQHWKEGGHDTLCRQIKKAGGAEQYNANTKYTEAVAVAAEKCADDTKGQTCYICTQALHWKTKEGLVRMCACRGTAGFAHVSCLAEQAKILCDEAEENNKPKNPAWVRWHTCSLCEQKYHGVVRCALGWACWKTNVGRPEAHWARLLAMSRLGNGLSAAKHHEDALFVQEAELSMWRRLGESEEQMLDVQTNLARTYHHCGRTEEANRMLRDVYSGCLKLNGEQSRDTLAAALNYSASLDALKRYREAKSVLRKMMPVARRVLGENNDATLRLRWTYARALSKDDGATLDDLREAVTTLEDTARTAQRVFGRAHPMVVQLERSLRESRAALRAREMQTTTLMSETAPLPPSWIAGNALVTGETEEQLMARLRREAKEINAAVAREAAEAKARLRNELPGYDEPG